MTYCKCTAPQVRRYKSKVEEFLMCGKCRMKWSPTKGSKPARTKTVARGNGLGIQKKVKAKKVRPVTVIAESNDGTSDSE